VIFFQACYLPIPNREIRQERVKTYINTGSLWVLRNETDEVQSPGEVGIKQEIVIKETVINGPPQRPLPPTPAVNELQMEGFDELYINSYDLIEGKNSHPVMILSAYCKHYRFTCTITI